MSSVTFLYLLKTSEKRRFYDVFRGYKNVTLDINELREQPLEVFSEYLIIETPLEGLLQ